MNQLLTAVMPWVFYFFVYAFLGWVAEVVYAAFETHSLVNRGFLNGPICPIYGFGMLALLGCLGAVGEGLHGWAELAVQFAAGITVTTLIELVGGWALYRIFHTRWWDYSMFRFNLGGYICLRFSLFWGVGSVFLVRVVHQPVRALETLLSSVLPQPLWWGICAALVLAFAVDVGLSAAAAVGLNKRLAEIDTLRGDLRAVSDRLTEKIGGQAMQMDELLDERRLQLRLAAMEGRADAAEARERLNALAARAKKVGSGMRELGGQRFFGAGRLVRAFPQMRAGYAEALETLRRHMPEK